MILLIGESCVDIFKYGEVHRVSPEGPFLIFDQKRDDSCESHYGMLGNTIRIFETLDIPNKFFTTISGEKYRYIDKKSGNIVFRIDMKEQIECFDTTCLKDIKPESILAIIVVDYNKGFLSGENLMAIGQFGRQNKIPLFLDTKRLLKKWARYYNVIKLNQYETEHNKESFLELFNYLQLMGKIVITMGGKGAIYGDECIVPRYQPGELVIDPIGAGDIFLTALVLFSLRHPTSSRSAQIQYAVDIATKSVCYRGTLTNEEIKEIFYG